MLDSRQTLQARYQLQQRLGRTATGRQTWLALDLQSNEWVTVKLLAFSPEMQWEELKLFEREAEVLQALNHPRIPRYRDYFALEREATSGLPWFGLVQDYIPGASLQELLDRGERFSEQQVRKVAVEILELLIYLHELSPPVLHRDIKPSNLILGEDRQIYLVDFGAVQAQAAVTGVTFTVVGTSGYAPLEQFWGRAVPASDLYALGATLIHLLTGTTPADLPLKESRIQFSDRVSLNPVLVSWIEKLTEITLEQRFTSAKQALSALELGQVQSAADAKLRAPRRILQPPRSKIEVQKSATRLEIHVPAKVVRTPVRAFVRGCVVILTSLPILMGCLVTAALGPATISALIIAWILFKTWGSASEIHFDRNRFEIKYKIFGLTFLGNRGFVSDILGVFMYKIRGTNQIKIHSANDLGTYSHFLAEDLSEMECTWLAQEIQNWLNSR